MANLSHQRPQPPLIALSGPALIQWLATDALVRDHVLTDGRHTVTYAEATGLLERLDARFEQSGATRHPLALECSQSVAGALALLYALSRERDVVLLPELGSAKESGTPRFIPSFCSHVVTASVRPGEDSPESCIEIVANEAFVEEPVVTENLQ